MTPALDLLFHTFEANGHDLYIIGGAVRDLLLGLDVHDYDFCTDATPQDICSWFENTVTTGSNFGTIGVVLDHQLYEITTYRSDHDYTDGRHPDTIRFSLTVQEDVRRRDFTINALFMDQHGTVFDCTGGLADLENGIIRCIGNPDRRFEEDRLRKWRCIRLASEKDLTIDAATLRSIQADPTCDGISPERLQTELSRILLGQNVTAGCTYLLKTGLLEALLSPLFPDDTKAMLSCLTRTLPITAAMPPILELRLSAFLLGLEARDRLTFLSHFRFSKAQIHAVQNYCQSAACCGSCNTVLFKQSLTALDRTQLQSFITFEEGILDAAPDSDIRRKAAGNLRICTRLLSDNEPLYLRDLALTGKDLLSLGFQGRQIGTILNDLLKWVWCFPQENTREKLLNYLERNPYGKTHLSKSD